MESPPSSSKGIDTTLIITLLLLYSGLCAGIWYYGYWSTFEINYMQYIDVTDIIKDFSLPFVKAMSATFLIFIVTLILYFGINALSKNDYGLKQEHLEKIAKSNFFYIISIVFLSSYTAIPLLDLNYKIGHNLYFTIIPYYFSIPISIMLVVNGRFLLYIENPLARFNLLNMIILIPIFSFCEAKMQAYQIANSELYKVVIKIEAADASNSKQLSHLLTWKLLGSSDNYTFLMDNQSKRVSTVNNDELLLIEYVIIDNR